MLEVTAFAIKDVEGTTVIAMKGVLKQQQSHRDRYCFAARDDQMTSTDGQFVLIILSSCL